MSRPFRSSSIVAAGSASYWTDLADGTMVGDGTLWQFGTRNPDYATTFRWFEHEWSGTVSGQMKIYVDGYHTGPALGPLTNWTFNGAGNPPAIALPDPPSYTDLNADIALVYADASDASNVNDGRTYLLTQSTDETLPYKDEIAPVNIVIDALPPTYLFRVKDAVIATTGEVVAGLSYWAQFHCRVRAVGRVLGYYDFGTTVQTVSSDDWTSEWYTAGSPGQSMEPFYDPLKASGSVAAGNPFGMSSEFGGTSFTLRRPIQASPPVLTQLFLGPVTLAGTKYWEARADL